MRKDLSGKAISTPIFARVISVMEAINFNELYSGNVVVTPDNTNPFFEMLLESYVSGEDIKLQGYFIVKDEMSNSYRILDYVKSSL